MCVTGSACSYYKRAYFTDDSYQPKVLEGIKYNKSITKQFFY